MMNKNTSKNIFKATITLIVSCALIMPVSIAVLNISKENATNYGRSGIRIYVDDDAPPGGDGSLEHPYQHIQYGIDNASIDDEVYVFNGTYNENIVVNKSILVTGENMNDTIIDGGGSRVVLIKADRVSISRFTIRGSEATQSSKNGINVKSDYVVIMNNTIINSLYGILFRHEQPHSSHIIIKGNTITNNEKGIWNLFAEYNNITGNTIAGNTYGIYLGVAGRLPWNPMMIKFHAPPYNDITENNIINNDNGIYILDSVPNNITENSITNNNQSGICTNDCLDVSPWRGRPNPSDNLYIAENTITNNGEGIFLIGSYRNIIYNNTISHSTYGIRLVKKAFSIPPPVGSTDNDIIGNNIINNSQGIWFSDICNNNSIIGNTITDNNEVGIRLRGADSNIITGNTIKNNNGTGTNIRRFSNYNIITENTITNNNLDGIMLHKSSNNYISKNTITNNVQYGIEIINISSNNRIYHNNFIDNLEGNAYDECSNNWDDGYPSGGNYWDDHPNFVDDFSGPGQDEPGSDGIVDLPYDIPGDSNQDQYPYMDPDGWTYQQPELAINISDGFIVVIKNVGYANATDINWTITIDGGFFFFTPTEDLGTIETLGYSESVEITMPTKGIGLGIFSDMPTITATAECAEGSSAEASLKFRILFSFIIIQ